MSFSDQWRAQVSSSLIECAKLVSTVTEVDLKYELLVVGVLWPIRQPVQEFNLEALQAVQEIVGGQARHVLRIIQQWDDDPVVAARDLATQAPRSGQLGQTFNALVAYFGAFPIFAKQLAEQAHPPTSRLQRVRESTKTMAKPPRVFISYMREDGQTPAAELRRRLEAEDIPLWPDLGHLAGERDEWQQAAQAIDQVKFMVLVMTPAAIRSDLVRKQWRYARQKGVCVYPVFEAKDLDFPLLPSWIRKVHFYNLNFEWPKLISDLHGDCQVPRIPFMVEDLPLDFVGRPAEVEQLVALLFDQKHEEAIASTVALSGAAGYGKTTLAKALCHDDDIRQVFHDGILWVTLGEHPGDLNRHVINLIEVLGGERPGFTSLDAAVVRFSELLASRDILLVIDDVWNAAHLKPFLQGGPRCARLITTRDIATLPLETKIVHVGSMQKNEAVALLGSELPYAHLEHLRRLADRLGQWPLLLKLANGALRDRVYNNQQTFLEALTYVNDKLDQVGLTAFDAQNPTTRNQAVGQTLEMSLGLLSEAQRARYQELAVFPEDANIPLAALEKLWQATGSLDDFDTEELCDRLHTLSLLSHFDLTGRYISLHKAIQSYLAYRQAAGLAGLHHQLLEAYRSSLIRPEEGWANLSLDEPYLWTHLAYHLVKAERTAELVNTVKDLLYLATKIHVCGAYYAESDLLTAEEAAPDDMLPGSLRRTISQASHLLARCETIHEVASTLGSQMVHLPELALLLAEARNRLPKPLLTAQHSLPDLPDFALIRTLRGHTTGVLDCAVSADGATLVSAAKNNVLTVWESETGVERFSLTITEAEIWACDISGDGAVVAVALDNGRLILYDTQSRSERLSWQGHQAGIVSCAINADASTLVSASKDKTLKVWNAQTGAEYLTLVGHERSVASCDISADGRTIVSASNDGTLKVWDVQTGVERFSFTVQFVGAGADRLTFFSQRDINFGCAISANGAMIAGTSSGGTVTVWDALTGVERFSLTGDKRGVHDCALNEAGTVIVCALSNGILKVWDIHSAAELLTLADHSRAVNSCAISADGSMIISTSNDKTIKIWDGHKKNTRLASTEQQGLVHSCAMSADGRVAVSAMADQTLKVWDVATGSVRLTLKGHTRKINDCAISQDGSVIVSASQDQTLIVWDAQTGTKRLTLTGHTWAVSGCAINADGSLVVSASDDKTLKIWEVKSGAERFTLPGHTRTVNSCALSADGRMLVSASGDGTLKVWDPYLGTKQMTLTGHTAWVASCAVSANGEVIVSASFDKTVKVWDTQNKTERHTLRGHTSSVSGCVMSADGSIIISVSRDKTVKVWDARSGEGLTTLYVDDPLLDCACSADASVIVAAGSSGLYFLQLER
jgi:WD40 repeat protein